MRDISKLLASTIRLDPADQAVLAHIRYDWRAPHRVYLHAMHWLNVYTALPFGGCPVLLIGPPKSGRTCVMKDQDALLVTQSINDGIPVRGSGYSPLGSPVAGKMDVSTIYSDIVRHALEPLPGYKIAYPDAKGGAPEVRLSRSVAQTRAANLQVIEKMANSGHYKALFLDDAEPSATLLKANRALEAPAVFSNICDRLGACTLVVSGGPAVYSFIGQSAREAARFNFIWMPPYYTSSKEDVKVYEAFLTTLEEVKLGPRFIVPGVLTGHSREVMEMCFGTIGITIDMVLFGVIYARMSNSPLDWPTLKDHLENNAMRRRETIEFGQKFFESARNHRMDEYRMWFRFFAKHGEDAKDTKKGSTTSTVSESSENTDASGRDESKAAGVSDSSSNKGRRRASNKTVREPM